jgi:hypothetical protein
MVMTIHDSTASANIEASTNQTSARRRAFAGEL